MPQRRSAEARAAGSEQIASGEDRAHRFISSGLLLHQKRKVTGGGWQGACDPKHRLGANRTRCGHDFVARSAGSGPRDHEAGQGRDQKDEAEGNARGQPWAAVTPASGRKATAAPSRKPQPGDRDRDHHGEEDQWHKDQRRRER